MLKKITILFTVLINFANAGSSTQSVDLVVDVSPACIISFNNANLTVNTTSGLDSTLSSTMTLDCTPQTIVNLHITSLNSWDLMASSGRKIPYTLRYSGGGYTSGANVNPTWSGQVANTIVLTGTAQNAPWQIPLLVNFSASSSDGTGDYSDTVTFQAVY